MADGGACGGGPRGYGRGPWGRGGYGPGPEAEGPEGFEGRGFEGRGFEGRGFGGPFASRIAERLGLRSEQMATAKEAFRDLEEASHEIRKVGRKVESSSRPRSAGSPWTRSPSAKPRRPTKR